jgi:hypothetical protein
MIDAGRARKSINKDIHRVKRMYRWAVEEELLAPDAYQKLRALLNARSHAGCVPQARPQVSLQYSTAVRRPTVNHPRAWSTMQITLYQRSYPVAGAPVALSLVPHSAAQKHTFTAGGRVYEAECRELQVVAPDGAKVDALKNLLCWTGDKGSIKSTAKEVFDLAQAGASGFQMAE